MYSHSGCLLDHVREITISINRSSNRLDSGMKQIAERTGVISREICFFKAQELEGQEIQG